MRYFPVIFLPIYFAVAFVLPSYRVWKKTGVNPVTFRGGDSAHDYIGKLFKIMMIGLTATVFAGAFFPNVSRFLLPIQELEHRAFQFTGIALLLLSLGWTVLAQIQMGNSWRIGIDEQKKTELVRTGVFRFSRNPIFLGMILTLIGLFLIMPNALTLFFPVLGVVLIQIQVRLEEEFLNRTHGVLYEQYRNMNRRWI